jgi:2-phospho-L-lactate/phosphoenolpyruvate guanylyltransferase
VLAIVPFKGLDGAKTRLAAALDAEQRGQLAVEMLERVLAACEGAVSIGRTLLVTPNPGMLGGGPGLVFDGCTGRADAAAAPLGGAHDVLVDGGTGHADAVALALADARAPEGALVVMADCPLVEPESLDALAEAARPLALAPAHDGGVNALALRRVDGFVPRFGVPAQTMVAAARAAGIEPVLVTDERLAFDVDRPADLARL